MNEKCNSHYKKTHLALSQFQDQITLLLLTHISQIDSVDCNMRKKSDEGL